MRDVAEEDEASDRVRGAVWDKTAVCISDGISYGLVVIRFLVFNDVAMSNSLLFNNKCPPYCPGEQDSGFMSFLKAVRLF